MQLNQGGTALSGAPVHDYGVQGRFLYSPKNARLPIDKEDDP